LEAHCLVARLAGVVIEDEAAEKVGRIEQMLAVPPKVTYPFLALIASGGHTSLMICKGLGEYDVLGGYSFLSPFLSLLTYLLIYLFIFRKLFPIGRWTMRLEKHSTKLRGLLDSARVEVVVLL
jgi:hypothetical protein